MIQRTNLFLMANLGSEVSKIIKAKEKGDMVMLSFAKDKSIKILSDLKSNTSMAHNCLNEIDILENVISDLTSENPKYKVSPLHLKTYFIPFTLRLMGA